MSVNRFRWERANAFYSYSLDRADGVLLRDDYTGQIAVFEPGADSVEALALIDAMVATGEDLWAPVYFEHLASDGDIAAIEKGQAA